MPSMAFLFPPKSSESTRAIEPPFVPSVSLAWSSTAPPAFSVEFSMKLSRLLSILFTAKAPA